MSSRGGGIYYSGTASAGEGVIEVTNTSFKGNTESTLYMIGVENQNEVDISVKGAQFRGLTSNAFNLRAGNHLLVDTFVDSGDEASPEHPIRLSSVSGSVVVSGLIHYGDNTPNAYVRYSGSSNVDFTPMGEFFCKGEPALPLIENTGSGVLSSKYLQQTFKGIGVAEKAFSDATLVIDIDEGLFFANGHGEFESLDELNAALGGEGTQSASEADSYATGIKIPVTPLTRDQEGTIELHVTKTDESNSNDGIIFMSLWDGNSFGSNGGVRIRDHQSEAGKTRLLISDSSGTETADLKTVATIADDAERKIVVPYKTDSSGLTVGELHSLMTAIATYRPTLSLLQSAVKVRSAVWSLTGWSLDPIGFQTQTRWKFRVKPDMVPAYNTSNLARSAQTQGIQNEPIQTKNRRGYRA